VNPEETALRVAGEVRREVHAMLGTPEARRRAGTAHGGDPTYGIDQVAEEVVRKLLSDTDQVAYFTEDEGLVVRGRPEVLFLIDPVDGTRPAAAGFESCGVSVAVAPFGDSAALGDVTYGCFVELATGSTFEARRGGGARAEGRRLEPSSTADLRRVFWAGGFRGQPAVPLATVLADLFDVPGSEGAFFDHGSAAYSLTRVATGQLDAFVDPGPAMIELAPGVEKYFRSVGGGHLLNTVTYDSAAAYLVLWELGLPCTDALGRSLQDVPLFDEGGRATQVSTVAASTPELHDDVLHLVANGLQRIQALY
jgi:myo-inositol-1(or 4)-monophosphatase